ncbi:MAG TPA: IclR family transcriptional regulator [Candidatus Sulfotelmatobacter sp.]|nr:IclR family transcriptional regulator [Candidatus Sulfotelmatobacter sp.]
MSDLNQGDKSYIAVMGKIFGVLECFAENGATQGLAFSQIAKALPFSRTTIHRILYSLGKLGYVEKAEVGSCYRLTHRFHELAEHAVHFRQLQSISKPLMKILLTRYAETVNLGSLDGGQIAYIDVEQGPNGLQFAAFPGDRNPAHCTALGKAILAFLPEPRIKAILGQDPLLKRTANTITQPGRLIHQLTAVRHQRVALDLEENVMGISCVAAPIFDPSGRVIAAFSVSGPTVRISGKLDALKSDVRAAASRVTRMLRPPQPTASPDAASRPHAAAF